MGHRILKSNHLLLTSASEVTHLCKPLQERLGITHFSYIRVYSDYSRTHLCTDAKWCEFFYKKYAEYEREEGLTEIHCHTLSGYATWDNLRDKMVQNDLRSYFNTANGILLINPLTNYVELACFCSTPDNYGATNLILSNIELLQKFVNYFKEQAAALIKKCDRDRLILKPAYINNQKKDLILSANEKNKFLEDINYFKKVKHCPFSQRELQCIYYSAQGKTAKEIAKIFNVSYKTIENHIAHAKDKLQIKKKTELVKYLTNFSNDDYKHK